MKINRKAPAELSKEIMRKARDYWTRLVDRALGQWLTPETPIKEVCDFAEVVFKNKELGDYQVDERFVRNAYACKTYSKLRSSIADAAQRRGVERNRVFEPVLRAFRGGVGPVVVERGLYQLACFVATSGVRERDRVDYVLPRSESVEYDVPWTIAVKLSSTAPIRLLTGSPAGRERAGR